MKPGIWKVLAIVFIILFVVESLFVIWMIYYSLKEDERTNECLYNICDEYPYAEYLDGVCYCYDYDVFGELYLDKTKYIK